MSHILKWECHIVLTNFQEEKEWETTSILKKEDLIQLREVLTSKMISNRSKDNYQDLTTVNFNSPQDNFLLNNLQGLSLNKIGNQDAYLTKLIIIKLEFL